MWQYRILISTFSWLYTVPFPLPQSPILLYRKTCAKGKRKKIADDHGKLGPGRKLQAKRFWGMEKKTLYRSLIFSPPHLKTIHWEFIPAIFTKFTGLSPIPSFGSLSSPYLFSKVRDDEGRMSFNSHFVSDSVTELSLY